MTEIERILIERDGMSPTEAEELVESLREEVASGADPEEILYDELGLEPDYIFDLLEE